MIKTAKWRECYKRYIMNFEKIYKILIEIVADQNSIEIESKLKAKEG